MNIICSGSMEIEETPIAYSTASSASPPRSLVRDRSPVHSGLQVVLSADEYNGDDNEVNIRDIDQEDIPTSLQFKVEVGGGLRILPMHFST